MADGLYLYFPGSTVAGETRDLAMAKLKAIDIEQVSFGAAVEVVVGAAAGGATMSKPAFDRVTITKPVDTGSCALFQTLCSGGRYTQAVVEARQPGSPETVSPRFRLTFATVYVESVNWRADGDRLMEEVTLRAGAVKVEYFKQDAAGVLSPGGSTTWSQLTASTKFP